MEPQFNAGSFIALAIASAGLVLALLHIPRMFLDGSLGLSETVGYGLLVLLLSIGVIQFWGSPTGYGVGILLALTTGTLPYFRYRLSTRSAESFAEREAARWRKTLAFDPNNAGAHGFLAKAYMGLGRLDEALVHYEAAMLMMPHDVQARRDYEIALQTRRHSHGEPWVCPTCRAENEAHTAACFRCLSRLHRIAPPGKPALDRAVIGAGLVALLLTALAIAGAMPPAIAVTIIALVSGGLYVYCYLSGTGVERD